MRSRASLRGHPIHPMLIPFPLAFLVGGFVADVAGALVGTEDLHVVAWYLVAAGVVAALAAAVPGFIDYVATVPPGSSGKQRATRHMAVNLSAVALFAGAWWIRGGPGVAPDPVLLAAEAIGVALLSTGGWMGGVLAFRNQIGVDHRYARAGKWKEARIRQTPGREWVTVARTDELEPDQMKLLKVAGQRIVLARTESGWTAFADRCTHRGGSLAGGVLACGVVVCPWHGSQFDVRTGRVSAGPAEEAIGTFDVEVHGDEVRLGPVT